MHEGVYIDPLLSEEMASNKVLDNQAKYTEVQAVFIALYEPITNGLPLLSKDKTLLFSASYQHQQLDKLKALGANMDNIIDHAMIILSSDHNYMWSSVPSGLYVHIWP